MNNLFLNQCFEIFDGLKKKTVFYQFYTLCTYLSIDRYTGFANFYSIRKRIHATRSVKLHLLYTYALIKCVPIYTIMLYQSK